ncbi:MAG: HIRAN domain-containing protein [Chitinophagaceae bacterium]|nr:HIRAN domain-containing protein [Chitinophagaceae bacterium]
MNRSGFLSTLLASIAIGRLPVSLTKDFRKIYLLQCFVAGFRHYDGMQLLDRMNEGDLLELVREPGNTYDSCAIALHWQGRKIGFVPASVNEMLSYLLDADALSLFAVITHLEKQSQPWENVAVAVYFVQEVNKALPAHASYLTRIEAPHYRTLGKGHTKTQEGPDMGDLFDSTERVIDLDAIPQEKEEVKAYFEKYYPQHAVEMDKPGRYVRVKDDGIFTYMYEISEEVRRVLNKKGEELLEFFIE